MATDLFNKYIWLVDTIYRADRITLEEINRKWIREEMSGKKPIPDRTFHRWTDAIEQFFDINIECDKKNGYCYYIEDAESLTQSIARNWLLDTFAVNNLINESHHLKHRILLEEIPSGRIHLTPIIEAMRDNREIWFEHQSHWAESSSFYTVQPYFVKVFKQRWYVIGYCKERKTMRTFALDRILQLETTDTHFQLPQDFNAQEFFLHSFGIFKQEDVSPCIIRIKAYEYQQQYLRSLPLHHSQQEIETAEDYSVFEYYLSPTFDFKQELLSRGEQVEVVYPEAFRKELAEEIKNMNGFYE